MPSPRAQLIAIQKRLWRANRELIDRSVLVKEPGFAAYERAYRRAVARFVRAVDHDRMIDAVLHREIVYVGDYHTCNQSQRSFLRILKAVARRDKRFVVGLELLHRQHQGTLDRFMSGRLSEKGFLKRIRLEEHWVFDLWESFKPIFDFCRYHRIPMVAIDAAPEGSTVRRRDAASAELIADLARKYPDRRIFVFIGDLHIAPPHLPRDVDRALAARGLSRTRLILYENSEAIYWELARKGREDSVEVVALPDGDFCRMHTPPVVCQRSYLNWLEHEEGEIDYADAKSSFLEIVDNLASFLDLDLGKARDEVEVFTSGDLSFLAQLKRRGDFSRRELETIKRQILASESYYIAKAKMVYLANLSINHAAEEAAHFIKNVSSGPEEPREIVDAFYANILHEALGFFGSKVVNHKRKCWHEKDFKALLSYFRSARVPKDRRLEYETAQRVVAYLELERRGRHLEESDVFASRMDLFLAITHALGYMLGDRLYYGLMSRKISKRQVRELFLDPWSGEGEPLDVYRLLRKMLARVKIPKRM